MAITDEQLVEVAVKEGLIDAEMVAMLRLRARRDRIALLDAVTSHGRFPVATLYRALADLRRLPFVDLSALPRLSPSLVQRLPTEMIQFLRVLPISEEGETVLIATADPDDRATLEAVARILGRPVKIALADPTALNEATERALAELSRQPVTGVAAVAADPVILLDRIFKEAFLRRASDIHLEPYPHGIRVRLRVDGWLQVFQTLGMQEGSGVVSRIKVLAGLDIAEQRAPQDGGFSYRLSRGADRTVDIRVATSPTRWGERATLRLLGMETSDLTLEAIGMSPQEMIQFRRVIKQPHGLILLTGPTGSGKSTTLYAALREINRPELNILTVEDPIEYVIAGISQIQVDGEKVTFASTLRALLRHDPDVLMVGEIRDAETAGVALKAAMTGHLVLSTLHTHSACGAVSRLADLGCERYLIGSTLAGVIAQRLVRRLCARCKRSRPALAKEAALLKVEGRDVEIYDAVGCASCLGSGYRGRVGLFETLWMDRMLAQRISRGATEEDLAEAASGKFTTLFTDGCAKVLAGITSLDEVLSATLYEE
ncbi:MAG: Flp pilus assembly complex ATPase component TadA [Candidatus Manganitrophus sp. SA1]|nr:Flp pilus assembly complex ATPase component TadA [Candidatus Manganitrophus morganii]